MTTSTATSASSDGGADIHPTLKRIGRAGWVAKGAVWAVLGALAVGIALGWGTSGESADQQGALRRIAETGPGGALMWVLTLGLALYALWRLASVVLPGDTDAEGMARRAAHLGSAVVYGFLTYTAFRLATDSGGGGSSGSGSGGGGSGGWIERTSRSLLEADGGRLLLGAAGVAVVGAGLFFAYRGLTTDFEDELEPGGVGPVDASTLRRLGTVGWIGRGIVIGLVGTFILSAAISADPDDAKGLDTALRSTADGGLGTALVLLAGICLVVYGVFAALSAPRRRLTA